MLLTAVYKKELPMPRTIIIKFMFRILYKKALVVLVFISLMKMASAQPDILSRLHSPVLFAGNDTTAYRDPAILYHNKMFFLFFTYIRTQEDSKVYSYVALSMSKDLQNWSPVKILTAKNQSLDYSSPGNIIRYKNEWILCLQTYPRPDYTAAQMPRFGNGNARLYLMRSKDLKTWSLPELLKVKGADTSFKKMGRMIDPYLLQDKMNKNKWWCFYKQNGVSMSFTYDFKNWRFAGYIQSGENVCVLMENNSYILFHSPKNGIAIKRFSDLLHWKDWGKLITLGQKEWQWARGRITAGVVIHPDKRLTDKKYLMFFHGSGTLTEEEGDFDKNASIGIAWSNDLLHWNWPKNK